MNGHVYGRLLVVGGLLSTSACATLTVNVDPSAREAGVRRGAQVLLYGSKSTIDNLKVYQGDARDPLKIVIVENPTFGQALGNATRQSIAENTAQAQANATGGVATAQYTRSMRMSPAIYLKQKGTHTLRFVRSDGTEATVDMRSHVGMSYVIVDWLLVAPTLGTSILIDWATGKWKKFDAIEVDHYFPRPLTSQVGTR